jgi:hypothetical protein
MNADEDGRFGRHGDNRAALQLTRIAGERREAIFSE